MRLGKFILTEGRGREIGQEEALDFIQNHCKKALKTFLKEKSNNVLYRGVPYNSEYYRIDPKTGTRESANTSNEYTLIMDNDPRWKEYPKRSKSLVCSTSYRKTGSYGNTYMVFAKDGSKYGVCPTDDLWQSFSSFKGMNMGSVNHYLRDLGIEVGAIDTDGGMRMYADDTYHDVITSIDKIGEFLDDIVVTHTDPNYGVIDNLMDNDIFRMWYKTDRKPFAKWLLSLYDPKANDFYVTDDVNKIFSTGVRSKEVWTDGESVLVGDLFEFRKNF